MPVLIMMNKPYNDEEALETVVSYVLRTGYGYCGGYGVESEKIGYEQLMRLGFEICKYYSDYQSVYGLHTDTDHLHLHFAVNTVSYKTGKMYAGGISDWYRLQGYIQSLLPRWYVDLRVSNGGEGQTDYSGDEKRYNLYA